MSRAKPKSLNRYHRNNLKQEILEQAENIYLKGGLDDLSVRQIAKELEVSPMAFYHHYKSLEELVETLVNKFLVELEAVAYQQIKDCEPGVEKLYHLGEAYIMYAYDYPKKFALVFNLNRHVLPISLQMDKILLYRLLFNVVAEIIGPQNTAQEKNLAALSAWSLVHGLATLFTGGLLGEVAKTRLEALQIAKIVVRSIKM